MVEADEAACLYKSAVAAGDGKAKVVTGDMPTIMAGLLLVGEDKAL